MSSTRIYLFHSILFVCSGFPFYFTHFFIEFFLSCPGFASHFHFRILFIVGIYSFHWSQLLSCFLIKEFAFIRFAFIHLLSNTLCSFPSDNDNSTIHSFQFFTFNKQQQKLLFILLVVHFQLTTMSFGHLHPVLIYSSCKTLNNNSIVSIYIYITAAISIDIQSSSIWSIILTL